MNRRPLLLAGLALLPGCALLSSPDYVEPRRYPLSPTRPEGWPRRAGRRTVLMRETRAAPELSGRLLRAVRADGTVQVESYAEWTAPPGEAAEQALRRWLVDSGAFRAVLAPGTRANPDLILETELTALHADLGRGVARAAMSGVLLTDTSAFGTRVTAQFSEQATAPLPPDRGVPPDAMAAGMVAALAALFERVETALRPYG